MKLFLFVPGFLLSCLIFQLKALLAVQVLYFITTCVET
uniref:Uncharacterized protein n=1 Tax=Arundo donax TaxID=35708 RepID=A0A0A9DU30_ARUDO